MANLTSIAPSSARALKRNAFSGSSSSSVFLNSWANAGAARASQRTVTKRRFTKRFSLAAGFGGDPVEVSGQSALDWDRDDLGKFVRMRAAQRLLERRIALGRGLDQHRVLLLVLHLAFPAIDRTARREDVDACSKLPVDQQVGDLLGGGAIGHVGQHQELGRLHGPILAMHKVTVQPSGQSFDVEEGEAVLTAALRQGVMLPYGCKNGACGSCKGKI